MTYKPLLVLIIISLLSAYQVKGKNPKESGIEKNIDTIPPKKIDTISKIRNTVSLGRDEISYIVTRNRMRNYFKKLPFKGWDDVIYKRQKDSLKELDKELKYVFRDVPLFKKTPRSY